MLYVVQECVSAHTWSYSMAVCHSQPLVCLSLLLLCTCYSLACSGVDDLFEMIQSKTYIQQLGYGIIKVFVVNNFPELGALFRQMEMSVSHNTTMAGEQTHKKESGMRCITLHSASLAVSSCLLDLVFDGACMVVSNWSASIALL